MSIRTPLNDASVLIVVNSAMARQRCNQAMLESLLQHTDRPYRLIWHHTMHDECATNYLVRAAQQGMIPHLFLHHPDEDWYVMNYFNMTCAMHNIRQVANAVPKPQWIVHCTDDLVFEPHWLSHTLDTIAEFQNDWPVGIWSPYRPPEHPCDPTPIERNGKRVWLYHTLAARCGFFKPEVFFDELGGLPVEVLHTADWKMLALMEAKGLKFVVIDGEKVKHKDCGYSPAHSGTIITGDGIKSTDEILLEKYGGYRGMPGTTWPPMDRPAV